MKDPITEGFPFRKDSKKKGIYKARTIQIKFEPPIFSIHPLRYFHINISSTELRVWLRVFSCGFYLCPVCIACLVCEGNRW